MSLGKRVLKAARRRLVGRLQPAPAPRRQGPPPPRPPQPGHVPAPPDFVGVGTMKSGTSWWSELIAAHPSVTPPMPGAKPIKELHFFDQFCDQPFTDEDRARYWSYFARPPGTMSGEWTPRYSVDFWTLPLLRIAAPDAKLLYLVRDPVDRYRSGITHTAQRGQPELKLPSDLARDHFQRGLYHAQLDWVLEHFPPERVLVLQFEQCVRDPEAELRRTYTFLGLDPSFVPDLTRVSTHGTKSVPVELPADLVTSLQRLYRADAEQLFTAVPELDASLWSTTVGDGRRTDAA